MPINPIDLQVNFGQTNQVGKQQGMTQGAEILRQDHASENIANKSVKDAEDVPETKDISQGPDKVKDEEKKKDTSRKKDKKAKNEKLEEKVEDEKDNKIKDPEVGQNIDVIG